MDRLGRALATRTLPEALSHDPRHADGILAYIATGPSNGRAEGVNAKIRTITKRSYGFHGRWSLIALIFLCCSGIVVPLQHRVPDITLVERPPNGWLALLREVADLATV